MTLETLLLLQKCLAAQTLSVADPAFVETAAAVSRALQELAIAISDAAEDTLAAA